MIVKIISGGQTGADRAVADVAINQSIPYGGWILHNKITCINMAIPSKKESAMAKNEKTSPKVASTAAKLLKNPKTPKAVKSVAGSALTQAPDKKKKK